MLFRSDSSPPGSSVHGIFQTRILEWVAISFSRGSSLPRDQTQVSRIAEGRAGPKVNGTLGGNSPGCGLEPSERKHSPTAASHAARAPWPWVWLRPDPLPPAVGVIPRGLAVDAEAPGVRWAHGDAGQRAQAQVPGGCGVPLDTGRWGLQVRRPREGPSTPTGRVSSC